MSKAKKFLESILNRRRMSTLNNIELEVEFEDTEEMEIEGLYPAGPKGAKGDKGEKGDKGDPRRKRLARNTGRKR